MGMVVGMFRVRVRGVVTVVRIGMVRVSQG